MLINASKSTHFVCATAAQANETELNLTGFSTERNLTSFRVNYAFSF